MTNGRGNPAEAWLWEKNNEYMDQPDPSMSICTTISTNETRKEKDKKQLSQKTERRPVRQGAELPTEVKMMHAIATLVNMRSSCGQMYLLNKQFIWRKT